MQQKINDTVICLRMGKIQQQKPYRVIFRSLLPKLHYYHNKRLQVKESQIHYQPIVEPLPPIPNWTCSVVTVPLLMHDSKVCN